MLSDVYYPTVDTTNVETLQYIVTDGTTFTDLQARDMTYTVQAVNDTGGMACRVTASDKDGLYSIETTYVTDPSRNAILMRLAFTPKPKPNKPGLQLFVRFDPTVNGNGGGGAGNGGADSATVDDTSGHPVLVASDPVTATNAANRDYAQPVFAALDGSFDEASVGFAGSESDGLAQLDDTHTLTPTHPESIAYRLDNETGAFVYTGDTEYSEAVVELARGADTLLIECSCPDDAPVPGHLTPGGVARMASEAGVDKAVLTHLYPSVERLDLRAEIGRRYDGKVVVAQDGKRFEV